MKKVVVLLFALSLLFACAKKEGSKGPYLAKVGNATITEADLDRELKLLPPFAQQLFEGKEGKEKFLDELIKKELLYQEALKKGLENDPEFKNKVEDFKKITLVGKLLEKEIEARSKVTMQDVKDYYEKHKDEFADVNQVRISQILVKTEDEANKIYDRLQKGENFAEVAKKSSIDTSAKNGGDLGFLSLQQMLPEIKSAISKLKVGEVGRPLKMRVGYSIIKVTDKKVGKPVEFDKVKNMVFQRLSAERQKEAFDSYVESLRKNFKVEINKDAIAKLPEGGVNKEGVPEKPGQPSGMKQVPKQ